jgi:3D (Asp-Asp-Asp) domain-containing protein
MRHNTPVKIKGMSGIYLVKDKMNKRWKNRIDIYMGNDVSAAMEWGRRNIEISYGIENIED